MQGVSIRPHRGFLRKRARYMTCTWPRLSILLCICAIGAIGCQGTSFIQVGANVGDPSRGAAVIAREGCGACHSISGIAGANGRVGPPLDNVGARTIIAGLLPNTPPNMITWLRAPQSVVPGNAMPDMGLSNKDAHDIAAYLYTLR